MKKRLIVCLIIVGLILITAGFLSKSLWTEKNKNDFTVTEKEEDEDKNVEKDKEIVKNEIYECINRVSENEDYVIDSIKEFTTNSGRLLKTTTMLRITCNNSEIYKNFKEDSQYQEFTDFNDKDMTFIFNKYDQDYMKDELITKYEVQESVLKEAGYTCKLISEK